MGWQQGFHFLQLLNTTLRLLSFTRFSFKSGNKRIEVRYFLLLLFIFNVLQANTFSALGFVRRVVTGVGDKLLLFNTDNLRNRVVDKSFIVRNQQ